MKLISTTQAAEALGVTPQHITRLCRSGKLPGRSVRKGQKTYWEVDCESVEYRSSQNPDPTVGTEGLAAPIDWVEFERLCATGAHRVVRKPCGQRTIGEYKRYLRLFFAEYGALTEKNMESALKTYEEKATPQKDYYTSRRMLHQSLMAIARYFHYREFVEEAFVESLHKYRPKPFYQHQSYPGYDKETVERAVKVVENYPHFNRYEKAVNTTLLWTAFYTGLRNSELCHLKITHLDLKGVIYGSASLLVENGKGRKNRTVGIPDRLKGILEAYIQERPDLKSPYLFQSNAGTPFQRTQITKKFSKIGDMLGIHLIPHALRSTCITHYLKREGIPLSIVAEMAGHSSFNTTKRYTKDRPQDVVAAMRRIQ